MSLNIADVFLAVAAAVPEREALICDGERLTFAEFDARSNQFAHHLLESGIAPGERVALYLGNSVEHLVALLGSLKARAVPVNVNWRYTGPELTYLFNDAAPAVAVVDQEFVAIAAQVLADTPSVRMAIVVGAGGDHTWPAKIDVVSYANAIGARSPRAPDLPRAGTDLILHYTGGTTGMPKGVLWQHEDFFVAALRGVNPMPGAEPYTTLEQVSNAAVQMSPMGYMCTAPLMHAAGLYPMLMALLIGSPIHIARKFDPRRVLRVMADEQLMIMTVVGDAIVRPLIDELAAHRDEYDLAAWFVMGSGGALLSSSVQAEIKQLVPQLIINNAYGSTETGANDALQIGSDGNARFAAGGSMTVLGDGLRPAAVGEVGRLARGGHVPLGYFNDPEKTAQTFPTIDGVRWAVLSDMGRLEEDGSITMLGRGTGTINTGGEKVFPEEVEQALKEHPAVHDALVVGVSDPRWGQRVAAVVALRGGGHVTVDELRQDCRARIAGYKIPSIIKIVDEVTRTPAGKPDYPWAQSQLDDVSES